MNTDDWDFMSSLEHDDNERDSDDGDDDQDGESRWHCVLGARCLVADPVHTSDECFDAEWAERYFAEQTEPNPQQGDRG